MTVLACRAGQPRRRRVAASLTAPLVAVVIACCLPGCGGDGSAGAKPEETGGTPPAAEPAKASPRPDSPGYAEFNSIADRLYAGENEYFGQSKIQAWRTALRNPNIPSRNRMLGNASLANLLLQQGEVDEALRHINEAEAMTRQPGTSADDLSHVLRIQGITYLRKAEVQNCIVRHNRDCCIFPLAGGGVHTDREPASRAREVYERCLQMNPGDLRSIWLLNIVYMALGQYPDGVPTRFRIPPAAFQSPAPVARFLDVAPGIGVDTFNLCGGVIADDFDGDGMIDIVTSTFDPRGPLTYYRNLGDGRFEDLTSKSRLDGQLGGLNCVGGDYDNDDDVDILVLRGAWLKDDGRIRNSLLRNEGDGTFTDVTRDAGLADPARPTQAAAWGDFDQDGDLDLYVVNESRAEMPEPVSYPAQLFRNEGDGSFTDIAASAGVTNDRYGKGVTAGDYDNDGDMDIYVSNFGNNRLYRNDGGMRFTDVAESLAVTRPSPRSFATWFFDYDNDGWLDLFVTAYEARVADIAADTFGVQHRGRPPCLYHNNGDGTFTDVTSSMGLSHAWLPMGANFGDVDNDGWLDMYLTTGEPNFEALMPNVLLANDGGRRFVNATQPAGLGHLQKGHGIAFADLDNDGDQDLYHQLGGFFPGDKFHNALFANPGPPPDSGHYLHVELVGTKTNRQAVGARIEVLLDTPAGSREVHRAVGSVSSFGGSPRRQEIGLGDASAIRSLSVWWPTSGTRHTFEDVPMDGMIRIVEDSDTFQPVELPSFDLSAGTQALP